MDLDQGSKHSILEVLVILLLLSFLPSTIPTASSIQSDYEALMHFKASSNSALKLASWRNESEPCSGSWYGVTCKNGRVTRLILEGIQLSGNVSTLTSLDQLRILSLKDNVFSSSLPELYNWKKLKLLYLSMNRFSGPLPQSISTLTGLWRLNLSNNKLSGDISSTFNALDHLLTLRLENNQFTGNISRFSLTKLQDFNVSGNALVGAIPASLATFPLSAFQGNLGLCGMPLLACQTRDPVSSAPFYPFIVPSNPSSKPSLQSVTTKSDKLGKGAIIAIIAGDFAILLLVAVFLLLCYFRKCPSSTTGKQLQASQPGKFVCPSRNHPVQLADGYKGSLVFIDETEHFDLEELLRASAEMLGKGSFGTAYKASLQDGSAVVVKRLKEIYTLGRKEFEQHMQIIGKLRHRNLVNLRAYCYAKREKLLVYDYLQNGSLFYLLHANRGPGRVPLDWTTRLKIALNAARGLAYIHHECKYLKMPHGNIKSSNVLLDKDGNACLSDFGLVMMASSSAVTSSLVGYRAPEHLETKKISQRADVYSFGVLLLEILTGKAPAQSHLEEGVDLPKWVQSTVREEWTSEVFDLELLRYRNIEEELVAMLQIAMTCVSASPELRPKMGQVVKMIEEIGGNNQSPQRTDSSFNSSTQSPSVSEGASL